MNLSSFTMKALTTSLLLAATTGVVFAKACYKGEVAPAPCCAPPPCCAPMGCLKDGFYVGAQAGYDSYSVRDSISIDADDIAGFGVLSANPTFANNNWVGGLFIGYGKYLCDMGYLGAEIFGNYNNSSNTGTTFSAGGLSFNDKFNVNSSYGVSILPGVRINNATLGYLRLGYNWARLKVTESVPGVISFNKTNTSTGFNYGLGMETLICDNWSVRTEYTHTNYSSFTSPLGTKLSPSDNQFMLGVVYHFA